MFLNITGLLFGNHNLSRGGGATPPYKKRNKNVSLILPRLLGYLPGALFVLRGSYELTVSGIVPGVGINVTYLTVLISLLLCKVYMGDD